MRIDDLTITEAVAEMHTFPHTECPGIAPAFAGLVGLSVARGYTREVQARFGGPQGCTHLEQLARSLGPVVVQAVTSRRARAVSRGGAEDLLIRRRAAPGPATPATSGPKAASPTRSWPPAGGRDRARTLPPPLETFRRAGPTVMGATTGPGAHRTSRRHAAPAAALPRPPPSWSLVRRRGRRAARVRAPPSPRPSPPRPPVLERGPDLRGQGGDVGGLGPVLVDGQGITLYLYETDQRGSPSRCYGICAVQWPPLTLPSGRGRAGGRARASSRGCSARAPRTDGTTQITYNGWPLYFWPPDRAPGKATGQALTNAGGRWYVLDAAGNARGRPP